MNRMWVMVAAALAAAVGFAAPEGRFADDFAGHVRHIYRIK